MLQSEALDVYKRSTPPEKWRLKYLGPLEIKKVMGPVTYMIEMPPSMKKAHNVFHVAKLNPYIGSRKNNQDIDVMIDADGTIEQVISEILDKNRWNRQDQYLAIFRRHNFRGSMDAQNGAWQLQGSSETV